MNRTLINHFSFTKALLGIIISAATALCGCSKTASSATGSEADNQELRTVLQQIANDAPGMIGIAIIDPCGDTLTINNAPHYQLMSVFKLHQAIAVAHVLDMQGATLDTIISFPRTELNPDTWSPMMKEHPEPTINLPASELLRYIIQLSDNNASNLLFDKIVSVSDCDSFIRRSTGIEDFRISFTERQMHADHALADGNCSSPLSCALLIDRIFTDSIVSAEKQLAIQQMLLECQTGFDRIYAPLEGKQGVALAHKTGSGFSNDNGELSAHNDVGRITLPDGRSYVLAVMVKNFKGDKAEASAVIAKISETVFNAFNR